MSTQLVANNKQSNVNVKKAKQTVSYSNFDASKLIVQTLEDNKLNTAQKLSMVRYKYDQYSDNLCQIQSHNCKLFTYGIPRAGPYYTSDKQRAFIKIPEDVNDPKSVLFFKKLEEIDEFMQSPEVKKKLFGSEKVANAYKYQPIVRVPEERDDVDDLDDNETKKKNNIPGPRYMKVKIDLDWETGNIKSKCYVKDENNKRVQIDGITTLDEFNKYVRYMSHICMVMIMNKIYATKAKVNGESRKYGPTFKLSGVVCEPPANGYADQGEDAFIDDEDEEGTTQLSGVKITADEDDDTPISLNESSVNVNLANALDGDEVNDDDDSQEVVEEPVKVVAQPVAAPKVTAKRGKK